MYVILAILGLGLGFLIGFVVGCPIGYFLHGSSVPVVSESVIRDLSGRITGIRRE